VIPLTIGFSPHVYTTKHIPSPAQASLPTPFSQSSCDHFGRRVKTTPDENKHIEWNDVFIDLKALANCIDVNLNELDLNARTTFIHREPSGFLSRNRIEESDNRSIAEYLNERGLFATQHNGCPDQRVVVIHVHDFQPKATIPTDWIDRQIVLYERKQFSCIQNCVADVCQMKDKNRVVFIVQYQADKTNRASSYQLTFLGQFCEVKARSPKEQDQYAPPL
jgi:hypothetical protein